MTMVVKVFSSMDAAEQARKALLSAGFSGDNVQLESTNDEAAPVEGNFALDRKDAGTDTLSGEVIPPSPDADHREAKAPRQPVQRGSLLLKVEAGDEAEADRAKGIIERYRGHDRGEIV